MEIATLICNNKLDYDMALKAYSMYKYLKSQGNQVEIIDYNFSNKNIRDKNTKMLYDFLEKNTVLSLRKYNTICQLEENLPLADKYLIVNGTYSDLSINFGKNKIAYYAKGMTNFELYRL